MENLQQSLLEHIADWMGLESTKFEMQFHQLNDHEDLHIKMADAAFKVFETETAIDYQECTSCDKHFDFDEMEQDSDQNYFCKPCYEELAPVMKAEYDEMVAKGEIEE